MWIDLRNKNMFRSCIMKLKWTNSNVATSPIFDGLLFSTVFGVFRVKNHYFTPTNLIFSNFKGGGAHGTSIQKLINIDRRKLVEIFSINLKEVIDRFIWTIELCRIWNFFNRTLFLTITNAMIYSSTFLRTTITNL
jgi:hypothetical protein